MKGLDGLDAIGQIDPELVKDANEIAPVRKTDVKRWLLGAACLCIALAGVLYFRPFSKPAAQEETLPPVSSNGPETPVNIPDHYSANEPVMGPMKGPDGAGDASDALRLSMISSYGDFRYDADLKAQNGQVILSPSLQEALKEVGKDALYRVEVIFFKDGVKLSNDSPEAASEAERLGREGYITAVETAVKDGAVQNIFITMHAMNKQLEDFASREDMGYYIVLYDEYTGILSTGPNVVYNGNDRMN